MIEIRIGSCRWLRAAHHLVFLLSLLTVLLANTPLAWKLSLISILVVVYIASMRSLMDFRNTGKLRIFSDGLVSLRTPRADVLAELPGRAWLSRWLVTVTLRDLDTGRTHSCLICACRNTAQDYRRLLVRLRVQNNDFRDGVTA